MPPSSIYNTVQTACRVRRQEEGSDYGETPLPALRLTRLKHLIQSAAANDTDIRANPECSTGVPVLDVTLQFLPRSGTLSSLEEAGGVLLRLSGDLVDLGSGMPYDPARYRLTTKEGFVYDLDQAFGIRQVTDPNGNTLTYSDAGIVHSSGKSVLFDRNPSGRITAEIDENGKRTTHTYDAAGRRIQATDAEKCAKDSGHYPVNSNTALREGQPPSLAAPQACR